MLLYDALVTFISPTPIAAGEVVVTVSQLLFAFFIVGYGVALYAMGWWKWQKLVTALINVVLLISLLSWLSSTQASLEKIALFLIIYAMIVLVLSLVVMMVAILVFTLRHQKAKVSPKLLPQAVAESIKDWSATHWISTVARTSTGFVDSMLGFLVFSFVIYQALLGVGNGFTLITLLAGNIVVYFILVRAIARHIGLLHLPPLHQFLANMVMKLRKK